ncbi:glutamate receptor-like [Babylonia areolata]|uniref:glutamate receptor-like n=1 Tax=Babylonia areolata TaxID=304850 RepID=UPI003FD4F329
MFDNHTVQALTAFLNEVQDLNLELSLNHSYTLRNDTSVLDVTDSFAVSNALCKHLSNGNLAIFGVSNASSMATIQSYTNTFQVPFVTFSMAHNTSSNTSFQVYMRPMHVHALVKLVLSYGWAHMYYIYNSDEGLIRLQQMFQAVAVYTHDKFLSIDAKRVTSEDDAFSLIRHLHKQDERKLRRFVLDMPVDQAERITLRVMRASDLNNAKFHFVLGDLSMLEMNLTNFSVGGLNITGFSLLVTEEVEMLLSRWPAQHGLHWPGAGTDTLKYEAALAVDAVRLFTKAVTSSVRDGQFLQKAFSDSSNALIKCTDDSHVRSGAGVQVLQEMKKTVFKGVTGHVAFDDTGHRKDFTLEVYDIDMNRGTAKVGQWDDSKKQLTFMEPRALEKLGVKDAPSINKTQRVTTIISEPYVMYKTKPSEDGSPPLAKEHLEGFCVDLAYAVAEKCKFDWVIHEVKDKTYGQPQENGTWNGMVGELIRHEADMAIAPLTITADRERVVDFTKPFMSLGISIMIKKPLNHKAHVFSFMDPLSYEIWMCIVFAYIGVSVVLFLVSRFSPNEWHLTVGEHQVTNDFSISNSLWFSLGAFMQQGCDISPRSMSGRIVGSVWWFFTLIIISSYTANLAAFLTVERMLTPIDSAEDLAKQTDIQYGAVKSGSTASFFMNSKVQIYQRMWAYMTSATPSVFVKRIEEGIQRVRTSNGKYAFLLESTTNDYYNQRKPCDTMMVGQNLNSNGFGIATPIGSDMKDPLNYAVLELREKGYLAKWETVWWIQKGECENKRNSSKEGAQSALTLQNVAGIFYILIGGLVTALLSAAIEFFYKSKIDSKKYQTSFGSALRSSARLSFRGHLDREASERYMNGSYKRALSNDRGTLYAYAPANQVAVDPYENTSAHQTEV